jgi:hypothetical protein
MQMAAPSTAMRSHSQRKFTILALIVLVPLILAFGVHSYLSVIGSRDLRDALEEASRDDPHWQLTDLEEMRAPVPDQENSATQVQAVRQLLPQNWPQWTVAKNAQDTQYGIDVREVLNTSFQELQPERQLSGPQIEAVRAELTRVEPALAAARKLTDMPWGRFPIVWAPDFITTRLDQQQGARHVVILLGFDALLKAQDQDYDGALLSCRAALNTSRALGDEPLLISQLIRVACRSVALKRIERIVAQGQPSSALLLNLQSDLRNEAEQPLLLWALRGERAGSHALMERIASGEIDIKLVEGLSRTGGGSPLSDLEPLYMRLTAKKQHGAIVHFLTQAVRVARLPCQEQKAQFDQLDATLPEQPAMVRLLAPAISKIAQATQRSQAECRCAVAALAAERYRREKGHWPKDLGELFPGYLGTTVDPFDGAPLRLRPFPEGIMIYSVGIDGVDNGGRLDLNPSLPGSDVGFRLWDVKFRRQPAKSLKLPEPPDRLGARMN